MVMHFSVFCYECLSLKKNFIIFLFIVVRNFTTNIFISLQDTDLLKFILKHHSENHICTEIFIKYLFYEKLSKIIEYFDILE